MKARIFISSGQRGTAQEPTSERGVTRIVKEMLEECGFEVYVAVDQHSLEGFTNNILSNLEKSEYYLFIDFIREEIENRNENKTNRNFRGSLFTHQELGIVTYLKKEHILIFQEKDVLERDGIKGFVQANPITFDDRNELPRLILQTIASEGWQTGWRNEPIMIREEDEYVDQLA